MGRGVAKVDEQAIPQILGDMALEAGDHLGTGVLIRPHHRAPVFWVKLSGEHRRVHQIAEQDGELAAFGVERGRGAGWEVLLGSAVCLAARRRDLSGCWSGWRLGYCCVTRPAQATPRVLDHLWVRVEEFVLEDR
jgi:hypothetical protein